ncbi:hypothetical protein ACLOJK_006517, partial [Asimina triloba]
EPSGKFDYYVLYPQSKKPSPQPQACHMISADYDEDFPPLSPYQDLATRTSYRQTIPDPSPQSQNKILKKIEQKQSQTDSRLQILQDLIKQIHERMGKLESELYAIVQKSNDMAATGEVIRTKEKERKSLQYQLNSIQSEVQTLTSPDPPTSGFFPWTHKPMYNPNYQPQPLLPPSLMSKQSQPLLPPSFVPKEPSKAHFQEWRPKPTPPLTIQQAAPVPASVPDKGKLPIMPIPEYILEIIGGASARLPDDILPVEEPNLISSFLRATALASPDSDTSEIESENEGPVYMTDPGPSVQHPDEPMGEAFKPTVQPQQFQTESKLLNQPHFSLENTPPSEWKQLIDEWYSWLLLQSLQPKAEMRNILHLFVNGFQGGVKDWWDRLGEYRQLQFLAFKDYDTVISALQIEFLGDVGHREDRARDEYLKMKCCSFSRKDLEKHYANMSSRYYLLGGLDDTNLKQ